jgi:hypothetical protein
MSAFNVGQSFCRNRDLFASGKSNALSRSVTQSSFLFSADTAVVKFFPAPFGDVLEIRVFAIYNRFFGCENKRQNQNQHVYRPI